jgi:pre-rRNA-processing protein TSR1
MFAEKHKLFLFLSVDRFKQKLRLIPCSRRLFDILEAARVSDFIILLMSAGIEVDQEGTLALTAIKAQGVPVLIGAVQVYYHWWNTTISSYSFNS